MTEGYTVEYTAGEVRRKIVFEPRAYAPGHWRTYEWTGCTWRCEGREPVEDVVIEEGHVLA